ncbi:MAG: extracellular solute-binding protein [Firmicutes bacterium]|jgi:ABC-type glycerol-3-phosphate transport system substrate-binding protein|nr:extracellular solute-binding protein [Bacillota bacterium]
MKKRSLFAGLISFIAVLTLVATPLQASQQIVVIDATSSITGTVQAAEEFTKKTGIKVEVLATTWAEFETRLRTMIAGGLPFDVFRVDQARGYLAMALGFSMPLNQFIERDGFDVSAFPDPVINYWLYEPTGDRYSIPYEVSSTVLWYSANAFREAGLDLLPTQWNHPDLQWDSFVEIAKRLTRDINGDGQIDRYGLASPTWHGGLYMGIWGQRWVDPFTNRFLGTSPEVVDAFTKWADLALVHGVIPRVGAPQGEQPAMVIGQTPGRFAVDPQMYGLAVAPMPWGTQSAMQGGINGWAISRTSQNPDAAWEFIKYFTADEGVMHWSNLRSGNSPVVHRAYTSKWVEMISNRLSLRPANVQTTILGGSAYFWDVPILVSPAWPNIQPLFMGALRSIAAGEKEARQAMAEIEGAINGYLREAPFVW